MEFWVKLKSGWDHDEELRALQLIHVRLRLFSFDTNRVLSSLSLSPGTGYRWASVIINVMVCLSILFFDSIPSLELKDIADRPGCDSRRDAVMPEHDPRIDLRRSSRTPDCSLSNGTIYLTDGDLFSRHAYRRL